MKLDKLAEVEKRGMEELFQTLKNRVNLEKFEELKLPIDNFRQSYFYKHLGPSFGLVFDEFDKLLAEYLDVLSFLYGCTEKIINSSRTVNEILLNTSIVVLEEGLQNLAFERLFRKLEIQVNGKKRKDFESSIDDVYYETIDLIISMYERVYSTFKRISDVFSEGPPGVAWLTKMYQVSTWGAAKRIEDFELLKQITKGGIKTENELRTQIFQKFIFVENAFIEVLEKIKKAHTSKKFSHNESEVVNKIEEHLVKNEMEFALLLLDELDLPKETTILLKKDFVKYKTEWSVGLISKEEYDVNSNRIAFSIIQIIKEE